MSRAACLRLALPVLAFALVGTARAEDLCAPVTRFLTGAPGAFAAARAAPDGDQQWSTAPVLPRSVCGLWESRAADADTLRCTINDRRSPDEVARFYEDNAVILDRCLAALPGLGRWVRATKPVTVEGLKGIETTWVHDTDTVRFKISLASYMRTATNTAYDSFVLEYLRY